MAVAQAHTVCNLSVSVKQNSYLLPWVQHVRIAVPVSSCSAFPGAHSELQLIKESRNFRLGARNACNLSASCSHLQQQQQRRSRGEAMVARASEVAVETGTLSLGLDVKETGLDHSRVQLKVQVPSSVCKDCYEQVLREFSKQAKIPGFRSGKDVPESVLIDHVGADQIRSSAVEAVLKRTLPEAMSSVAGRSLKDSEHILTKFSDLVDDFVPEKSLSYELAVDVAPEVRWNPENGYKNLKVKVECEANEAEAARKAADAELQSRLKDLGSLQAISGRGMEMGDVAIIDVSATRLNEDGTAGDEIFSCKQKGFQLDTDGGGSFLPGFVEALVGIQIGETRTFDLTFPETWEQESLRGLQARFTVEGKELFTRQIPELSDELAPQLVANCTNIPEVKEVLLKKHAEQVERVKKQATRFAVANALTRVVDVEIPNSLLEEQGRQMYAAKLIELQASMKLPRDQLVALSSAEMVQNYLDAQRSRISDSVKQSLAVAEIYKQENLKISDEELDMEVYSAIEEFKRYDQEYDDARVREQARELLEGSKVLDWLTEHADITFVPKQLS